VKSRSIPPHREVLMFSTSQDDHIQCHAHKTNSSLRLLQIAIPVRQSDQHDSARFLFFPDTHASLSFLKKATMVTSGIRGRGSIQPLSISSPGEGASPQESRLPRQPGSAELVCALSASDEDCLISTTLQPNEPRNISARYFSPFRHMPYITARTFLCVFNLACT